MTQFPVEQFKKEWIMERLHDAMIEALFKQGLLTETQRREVCAVLNRNIRNAPSRKKQ